MSYRLNLRIVGPKDNETYYDPRTTTSKRLSPGVYMSVFAKMSDGTEREAIIVLDSDRVMHRLLEIVDEEIASAAMGETRLIQVRGGQVAEMGDAWLRERTEHVRSDASAELQEALERLAVAKRVFDRAQER